MKCVDLADFLPFLVYTAAIKIFNHKKAQLLFATDAPSTLSRKLDGQTLENIDSGEILAIFGSFWVILGSFLTSHFDHLDTSHKKGLPALYH